MVASVATVRSFAKLYPSPAAHPRGGPSSWVGLCGMFMYRYGEYSSPGFASKVGTSGPDAFDVSRTSDIVSARAAEAPIGAIHHFRSRTVTNRPGHVGLELVGGGKGMASATSAAVGTKLAPGLRLSTVSAYLAKMTGMAYVGWSMDYSGAAYATTAPAGSGGSPIMAISLADVKAIWAHTVRRGGQEVPALQELADAKTAATSAALDSAAALAILKGGLPVAINAAAAALIASKMPKPPTAAEIARAVCDEQDARARKRLG